MAAITKQNILDDARVLYDINVDEKAAKLDLFIRQTIVDIVRKSTGMLSNRHATATVTNGKIPLPADFETIYSIFQNSVEVKPVDAITMLRWNQQSLIGAPYCYLYIDDATADITAEVKNLGDGAEVNIAYKRRTDDITEIPEQYRYMVLDGVSWRYEKYEQRRELQSYKDTYEQYYDFLEDLAIRTSNQENWTQKFNHLDEWEAILSRL